MKIELDDIKNYANRETLEKHLEATINSLVNVLQKTLAEKAENYSERPCLDPFRAEGIEYALQQINDFIGTTYETDIRVLVDHYNRPLKKK